MAHEVVVVGGGIGGLTVAALLAARGIDVCLFERQPEVGGCVTNVEKFGYTFEPTLGLYSGWGKGEIFEGLFSELPVEPPETRPVNPSFVVRLEDGTQIPVVSNEQAFDAMLRSTFPECAERASHFYRDVAAAHELSQQVNKRTRRILNLFPRRGPASQISKLKEQTVERQLTGMPHGFRRFIELQLLAFSETSLDRWSFLDAGVALTQTRGQFFAIRGGAAALAAALSASIRKSGGSVRLSSPVLRLSYNEQGDATGVDLLTGENVPATKAIISNMTVWDTYGKLIGLQRTPADLRRQLNALKSSGVYLVFAGIDEEVARTLSEHMLVAGDESSDSEALIDTTGFAFSVAPEWDRRAPNGKRAATIAFRTEVDRWFTFHADHTVHEEHDQAALELAWSLVHKRLPELGPGIEVIETATPQSYYDVTRRKLGMVGPIVRVLGGSRHSSPHATNLPNVFAIGDTTSPLPGIAGIAESATSLVNSILHFI